MSDLAATNCGCGEERTGCGCDNNCGCNNGCGNWGMGNWGGNCCNIIWIIILLSFCGGNNWGNNCGCNHGNGDCFCVDAATDLDADIITPGRG